MSNISSDTPSILVSTTEDNTESSMQLQCGWYWKISRVFLSLWSRSSGLMWKLSNVLKITLSHCSWRKTCFFNMAFPDRDRNKIICNTKSLFLDNYSPNSIRAGDLNLNSKHLLYIALHSLKRNYISEALAHWKAKCVHQFKKVHLVSAVRNRRVCISVPEFSKYFT